jgi:hypothetical protein
MLTGVGGVVMENAPAVRLMLLIAPAWLPVFWMLMLALVVDPTAVLGKLAVPGLARGVLVDPRTKLYTSCGPSPVPDKLKVALSISSCAFVGPDVVGLNMSVNVSVAPGARVCTGTGGRKLPTLKPVPTTEIALTDPGEFPVFVT